MVKLTGYLCAIMINESAVTHPDFELELTHDGREAMAEHSSSCLVRAYSLGTLSSSA